MSIIGSTAITAPRSGKYASIPIPDITTDIAIVAVPGRPAIPNELIAMITKSIIQKLKSIGVLVICASIIAVSAG